jgi:hypothetical protein
LLPLLDLIDIFTEFKEWCKGFRGAQEDLYDIAAAFGDFTVDVE